MAMKIETRELQPILAETQSAEGYALGLNGILKGYANEMAISYLNRTGSATVKIDSGILLWQGKRIYADNEGISFEIPNETTNNTKYDIYLRIDMGQPDNVVAVYSKTGTYPSGYVTDDLFNNFRNGVNFVKIGEFTNTNTGIIQAVKTIDTAGNATTITIPTIAPITAYGGKDEGTINLIKVGNVVQIANVVGTSISSNITSSAWVKGGQLPVGYRPSTDVYNMHHGSGDAYYMTQIKPDGSINFGRYSVSGYTNPWLPLTITFIAAR